MRRGFIVTRSTGRAEIFRRVEERVPNRPIQRITNSNQTRQCQVALQRLTEAEINRYCASEPETNLTIQKDEQSQSVSVVEGMNHQTEQPESEQLAKEIDRLKADHNMLVSSFSKRIETMSKQLNELKLCVVEDNCGNFSSAQFCYDYFDKTLLFAHHTLT